MRKKIQTHKFTTGQLLEWGKQFSNFILLNSNNDQQLQKDEYGKYDLLAAAGSVAFPDPGKNLFEELNKFHNKHIDWIFGYLTYDVKNQIENLTSENHDGIGAPEYRFFRPRYVITVKGNDAEVHYDDTSDTAESVRKISEDILNSRITSIQTESPEIIARTTREKYISTFEKIKRHIQLGDIYEMNYCIEFFSGNASIDPAHIYQKLNELSPMPFSAFMRMDDLYLMCASPERYLARRKNKIISQPIKGTAKRGEDGKSDEIIKINLSKNPKEQSENVMIVDMVRNDLSRTAARGSVKVEELFGVKTFRQLHQMISTVVSEIKARIPFTEVIAKSYPMGSMTGAPKVSAMKLIEEYEEVKRGLFSGSVGYISPDGDFDFNVVIRSIIYNSENSYLSYMAGSAITIAANAEQEYEECLLKASAMKHVLSAQIQNTSE